MLSLTISCIYDVNELEENIIVCFWNHVHVMNKAILNIFIIHFNRIETFEGDVLRT